MAQESSPLSFDAPISELLAYKHTILLTGDIEPKTTAGLLSDIRKTPSGEPVVIFSDGEGGAFDAAMGICHMLRNLKRKVITICLARCTSSGLTIFLAGDRRIASPNCLFIHHRVRQQFGDTYTLTAPRLHIEREMYQWMDDEGDRWMQHRAGITDDDMKKFAGEGKNFCGMKAMQYNIATELVPSHATIPLWTDAY